MIKRKVAITGNSICLVLDRTIREILNVKTKNDFVNVEIKDGKIIVSKIEEKEVC